MVGIIILLIIIGTAAYAYFSPKKTPTIPGLGETTLTAKPTPIPTPTPTPTKLFHGKDTYNISGGAPDDPHFPEVTIDPLDPAVGAQQAFTVKITSKYAVTTAWLSIRTDTKTTKLPLALSSGTGENGVWQASWTVPESYLYNYQITPTAQTAYAQASATITVRQRK